MLVVFSHSIIHGLGFFIAGDPQGPATLISTLLLQTHARQLYSLALTQFVLHLGGLPLRRYGMQITQCYHGHHAYLDHGSSETQAQQQCHPIQIVVSCSLFMLRLNHFHHEISQLYYIHYKPCSKHTAIMVKSAQHLTSGSKIFHYPKSQTCIPCLLKIILNAHLIGT